jgi:thioredoxin reductase (NADPH)
MTRSMIENVIIVGSGPSGLTAAIYTGRANLAPLVFTGLSPGGQLTTTTEVENFPGFPQGINGPELMESFRKQAERFGARFQDVPVTRVDFSTRPLRVWAEGEDAPHEARTVIVSTGASSRPIGLPNERALTGRGVSTCATCDGFFFRGKEIAVVGGGDSALEEATFLTRFASRVTVIHRRTELRASKIMQKRARENPKIAWKLPTVVTELYEKDGKLVGVRLRDVGSGAEEDLPISGLFVAIGHVPNTRIFEGQIPLDGNGYLIVQGTGTGTSIPGVFACGDCVDHIYRQAITAAGMGCMAAIDAERYLASIEA